MIKRLPILFLALAVALSYSWGFGAKVSAASPIMYSGTVTWAVSRKGVTNNADFNYSVLEEQLPVLRSAGLITDQLGGFPWNYQNQTSYSNFPCWISVKSTDLAHNGGYIYYAFAFAYSTHNSIQNLTVTQANAQAKLYRSGSIDSINNNGTSLSMTKSSTTQPNSYISESYTAVQVTEPIFERITQYDGSSFATKAWYLSQSNTDFLEHGVANTLVYDYSESSLNWIRTNTIFGRITVPATNITSTDWTTVWIDLRNIVSGTFQSQLNQTGYHFSDDTNGFANLYGGSILYMLPIYCYACSTDNYQEIEQYLAQILTALNNQSGSDIPQSVLESYAALGSEAREAAHAAASQMAQNYPTYDASAMDISNIVDPTAKDQFKSIMGFLTNNKIIRILGVVFTLVLIGFVFFGKK